VINGTQVTIVGNVGATPEIRVSGSGTHVTTLSVAVSERKYNRDTNKYADGPVTWYRVNVWRDMADNACASLRQGMRVIVIGNLAARDWTNGDKKGTAWEITADAIGPDLAFATADVRRGSAMSRDIPPAEDPWAGREVLPVGQRPKQASDSDAPDAGDTPGPSSTAEVTEAINKSSLGTPGARKLRQRRPRAAGATPE
jgi:single-strand DNA-binding protein